MGKTVLNPERLYKIGKRIERRNSRKMRRSRLVAEKLTWQDITPFRCRRLAWRARRLSRCLEALENRRQDVLRRLKISLLKETGGIYG